MVLCGTIRQRSCVGQTDNADIWDLLEQIAAYRTDTNFSKAECRDKRVLSLSLSGLSSGNSKAFSPCVLFHGSPDSLLEKEGFFVSKREKLEVSDPRLVALSHVFLSRRRPVSAEPDVSIHCCHGQSDS